MSKEEAAPAKYKGFSDREIIADLFQEQAKAMASTGLVGFVIGVSCRGNGHQCNIIHVSNDINSIPQQIKLIDSKTDKYAEETLKTSIFSRGWFIISPGEMYKLDPNETLVVDLLKPQK